MIKVSKLNKEDFYINPGLIEKIDVTPDTVITLLNGKKYVISNEIQEILDEISEYYKVVNAISPQIIVNANNAKAE